MNKLNNIFSIVIILEFCLTLNLHMNLTNLKKSCRDTTFQTKLCIKSKPKLYFTLPLLLFFDFQFLLSDLEKKLWTEG